MADPLARRFQSDPVPERRFRIGPHRVVRVQGSNVRKNHLERVPRPVAKALERFPDDVPSTRETPGFCMRPPGPDRGESPLDTRPPPRWFVPYERARLLGNFECARPTDDRVRLQ